MAVTYTTAVKEDRMEAVIAAIDAGAGAGYIEIGTTAMALVLATIPLADPCGTASGAVLTFDCDPDISDASADASGTAAAARIRDSNATDIITGLTVTTAAVGTGDIQLDSVDITLTQTVTIATATITHAT